MGRRSETNRRQKQEPLTRGVLVPLDPWCFARNAKIPLISAGPPLAVEHVHLLPFPAVYTDLDEYATRNIDRLVSPGIVAMICPTVKPFQATENRTEH